jgi:hypothetical protein
VVLSVWGICGAYLFRNPEVPVSLKHLWCLFVSEPCGASLLGALWTTCLSGASVMPFCLGSLLCVSVWGICDAFLLRISAVLVCLGHL